MQSLTQQLADFASHTGYGDIPQSVIHEAKRVILDSLGCALAGMAVDKGSLSVKLARRLGGPPEASIIGSRGKVSCAQAVFANGELINALDFDAILRPLIHVTPFVLPSALALGECNKSSGQQFILAAVLGHEVSCRVGAGMSSPRKIIGEGPDRGKMEWLPVYGYSANVFGSAAAAGIMLGLDSNRMAYAFGIAGYNSPMQASSQWHHSGTEALTKFASGGWIAQTGLTAALLAEMGYSGDVTVLDGEHSYWRFAGSETWRPERVVHNLGRDWHLLNTRYKLYPCCGIIQASLDCLTDILEEKRLEAKDIEKIQVWLDPHAEMPLWQNRNIDNEVQAQFSVPYVIAVGASGLSRGIEWQDPATRHSPDVQQLMDRVSYSTHPGFGAAALANPAAQMARVEVRSHGQTFSKETDFTRGAATPEIAHVSDEVLEDKFCQNVSGILPRQRIVKIINTVWELEQLQDITQLTSLLAK